MQTTMGRRVFDKPGCWEKDVGGKEEGGGTAEDSEGEEEIHRSPAHMTFRSRGCKRESVVGKEETWKLQQEWFRDRETVRDNLIRGR